MNNEQLNKLDVATNYLAGEVKGIIADINAEEGIAEPAKKKIKGKLEDLASRLSSVGSSPENPLPGIMGSSTPVALGEVPQDDYTGTTEAGKEAGGNSTQQDNTGANFDPNARVDIGAANANANAVLDPSPQPVQTLPGDTQVNLNGDDTAIQVGKQPDANNGDKETDPNKDNNPANDEAVVNDEDTFIKPETLAKNKGGKKS